MFQIHWTPIAIETYEHILDFILENWSMEVVLKLEEKVKALEARLQKNEYLCPASLSQPLLRKCVVTAHTPMLYRVIDNKIEVLAFFDNRSDYSF